MGTPQAASIDTVNNNTLSIDPDAKNVNVKTTERDDTSNDVSIHLKRKVVDDAEVEDAKIPRVGGEEKNVANQEEDVSNEIWEDMIPDHWRNSIYTDAAKDNCMGKLFADMLELFRSQENVSSIVEVGCGTAELFNKIAKDYKLTVGVDISPKMIEIAYALHPHLKEESTNCKLLVGNAVNLTSLIAEYDLGSNPICTMVMNTFGILPSHIRPRVVKEMWKVADGGKLIIGCWNQAHLREGFESYYAKQPDLCGTAVESDFDFENGNFKCADSGYESHWYKEEELRGILSSAAPFPIKLEFITKGVGIFAIGRRDDSQNDTN